MWGSVPGGYRNTINDNIVLILMIETLEGLKNSDEIAKVAGVSAIFAASTDIGNFSGYAQGTPDYERAINIVHDSALRAGVRLCDPLACRDRPDFTCFQPGSEIAAITLVLIGRPRTAPPPACPAYSLADRARRPRPECRTDEHCEKPLPHDQSPGIDERVEPETMLEPVPFAQA